MNFKTWFESIENTRDAVLQALLPGLEMDDAMTLSIDALDKEEAKSKLKLLGLFKELPFDKQQFIFSMIDSGRGNVAELIHQISVS